MQRLPEFCQENGPDERPDIAKAVQSHNPQSRLLWNILAERWQVWEEHRKMPGQWSCSFTWEDPKDNSFRHLEYDGIMLAMRQEDLERYGSAQAWCDEIWRRREARDAAAQKELHDGLVAAMSDDKRLFRAFVNDNRPTGLTREELVAASRSCNDQV